MAGEDWIDHPPLLKAMDASLTREERIDTLDLRAVNGKVPDIDVADRLTGAKVTLTIEGASTLELDISDPDWEIEASGLLDKDKDGRLDAVAMTLDSLSWRLAKAARNDGQTLQLTFEDEVWALLRAHAKRLAVSRNALTRAQFIEKMVREIKTRKVAFYAPEKGRKQPAALPDYPDLVPKQDDSKSTKSSYTDETWAAALLESLGIQQTTANMQAIIGWERAEGGHWHNDAKYNPLNTTQAMPGAGNTGSQGNIKVYRSWAQGLEATVKTLHNGNYGGILSALKGDHPLAVAAAISASPWGTKSPLIDNAIRSAPSNLKDVDGGGSGASDSSSTSSSTVVVVKSYRFTRGLPGQPENSAQCATRLADEVHWRFFVSGGVVWFTTDHWLISRPADLILTGLDAPGLMDRPSYEWDHRKKVATCELQVAANAWQVRPGAAVILHDMGPITGRWLVETIEFDLLDPLAASITLIQPTKPKKEPAPDVFTVSKDNTDASSADVPSGKPGDKLKNANIGSPIPGQKWHPMTHQTGGLPGYPAFDYMAPAGTPVVAPETGTIRKLSGHDPKLGGSPGGPLGYSIYVHAPPRDYFMTHLDKVSVKVGQQVTQGEQIAEVANGPASWSTPHCHQGINGPTPPK